MLFRYYKLLLVQRTNNQFIQLFRYGIVAVCSLAVDITILAGLTELVHMHYITAATIGFIAGLVVNYYLSIKWIFHNPKVKKRSTEFTVVALIGTFGLIINDTLLWFLTSEIGMYYLYSKLIACVCVFFYNFFVRRAILY